MFIVSNILRRNSSTVLLSRYKSKTHWAQLKKKTGPKYKALSHFDEFYGSVFGKQWEPIREAMMRRNKYVAVVNNYGDSEETMEYLTSRGAHCLNKLMTVQKDFNNQYNPTTKNTTEQNHPEDRDKYTEKLQNYANKLKSDEISNISKHSDITLDKLHTEEDGLSARELKLVREAGIPTKTLVQSMAEAEIDMTRIIDPSMGMTSEALYQYVPATQLKGMDEWVSESVHYSYANKDQEFPLIVETETEFKYPEHLKVFAYEMDSEWSMFPEPKRGQTGVFNYYPMDGGSILPVLALCLEPGDRVLDLCSAPGGKALVALQTLLPDVVVCNDVSISRSNRTERTFKDYLFDFETSNKWRERVIISKEDGRVFTDDQGFDKVLVDVPCTTDRLSITKIEDNNIFRPDRIKERLRLPEMQSHLLTAALSLVRRGGAVVYSTCSLSPVQNDGVVHMALRRAFETHGVVAAVRDLTAALSPLSTTLSLGHGVTAPRYGQLVIPDARANYGPTYLARLVRLQ